MFKILVRLQENDRYVVSRTFNVSVDRAPLLVFEKLVETAKGATEPKTKSKK